MRPKVERHSEEAEKAVRDIRRATRRQYSAAEKVRIVEIDTSKGPDRGFASSEMVELTASSADRGLRRRKRSTPCDTGRIRTIGYPGLKGHNGNPG